MKLNIVGVGFKAAIIDTNLQLKIGFSHIVNYKIPEGIKISISSQKALTLIIFGNDLQKVTQTAAEIRNLKPVEPYKGKGIKYSKEVVKKKEGKKTNV
jgi:large subunit ribosomal protein L6